MAERSNVPKFGNWEGEENVPYTAYFEKARKGRAPGGGGGRVTNPNDPEYHSDSQQSQQAPTRTTKPEEGVDPVRKSREGTRSREESEMKQFGGGGGDGSGGSSSNEKRQGRTSQNNSYDKSPLHKNSYDGGAGRTKPKPNLRADESPEKVTVVPKFGDWDENNPASADGYTHIFNKVREERSTAANVSGSARTPTHPSSRNGPSSSSKCCCFGFGGK